MIAGEKAPDFTLRDHTGQDWSLSAMLSDGPVVLFFFPKASSPICTAQACHFRDLNHEFAAVGAHRVGISTDTVDKQAHFAQQRSFDFPLLADPDAVVAEEFGVRRGRLSKLGKSVSARQAGRHGQHLRRRGLLARLMPVRRTTFVIDTDRTVLKVISNELRAAVHADEALRLLQNYTPTHRAPLVRDKRPLVQHPPRAESHQASRPHIDIVEGNLAAQEGHLVVGTCDTFDALIPEVTGRSDAPGLSSELVAARHSVIQLGVVAEDGRTVRYPLGTVAVVDSPARKLFFFAYATQDETRAVRGTTGGLWAALSSLWAEVARHCNGGTVCMPVIGGGMHTESGVVPEQEAIRSIILSLMFASRFNHVCDELRIVVRPEHYRRLDLLELQSFITSFDPS